jgi:tetratricopeptide (TPR) repeat protein
MYFFPKTNKINRSPIRNALNTLEAGQKFELLEFLRHCKSSDELNYLCSRILFNKFLFFSIFSDPLLEEIFNTISLPDSAELKTLRNHFRITRKLSTCANSNTSYYIRNNDILWNLLFADLLSLEVDRTSHLFINLKNYLDWGNYQQTLKEPKTLAKIFFPLYKALKNETNIPVSFLLECLKIILTLDTNHIESRLEYASVLKLISNPEQAQINLESSLKMGISDPRVLLELITLYQGTKSPAEISEICESCYHIPRNRNHPDTLEEIASILYTQGDFNGSLFYLLKALSISKSKEHLYKSLGKTLYQLNQNQSAQWCFKAAGGDSSPIAIRIPESLKVMLKESGKWSQPISSKYVFLDPNERACICFCPVDSSEQTLFYPENSGPYVLKMDSPPSLNLIQESIQPAETTPNYEYASVRFSLEIENLRTLSYFQFCAERIPSNHPVIIREKSKE